MHNLYPYRTLALPPKKAKSWFLLFFWATISMTAQVPMSQEEASSLRAKVKSQAEATQTISSDFIQKKHLDFLENDIESSGTLAFKAPDMVKWEYTSPFTYSALFKDQKLYINDNGKKSNTDLGSDTVFKKMNTLITASIRGDMFKDTSFDIRFFKHEGKNLIHFIPKNPQFATFISAFHITFTDKGIVETVKMIEPTGDYTQIVFSNRIQNQPLSDAVFAH